MSTASARKAPAPEAPGHPSQSNRPTTPRGATKATAPGLARTSSLRNSTPLSARAAVRKPGTPSATASATKSADNTSQGTMDEDTHALIEDLRSRLQSVEEASEEYRKQVEGLQLRLGEASAEHNKVEEQLHEEQERTEGLENQKRDALRQKRELEGIYEAERASFMKIQESAQNREDELREIIDRLKESLTEKDLPGSPMVGDDGRLSRNPSSPSLDHGGPHFAPTSALSRSNSRNNSKILLQKDKVIESLRFELAEAQVKLVEMENMGGGRMQELERTLLETRMANARLMEDNESFQLLLSEKTLNGDFARQDILQAPSPLATDRSPPRDNRASTLEDELNLSSSVDSEAAVVPEEGQVKDKRLLQAEVSSLKDQNKALTVYINKIIERILQRQGGFENILSTADDVGGDPVPSLPAAPPAPDTDKELPPPPPKDTTGTSPSAPTSFLERAKSVINRDNTRPRPAGQNSQPSITDDPATAPSIPLGRTTSVRRSVQYDRRATVDWSNNAAASVISNMTRGAHTTESTNPASPGIVSQRNSFFAFGAGAGRTASGSTQPRPSTALNYQENMAPPESFASIGASPTKRERQAALDALEGGSESTPPTSVSDAPSPPRSMSSGDFRGGPSVMMGSKMRPLRLVREKEEDEAAKKAANRASWIPTGWFGGKEKDGGRGQGID